MTINSYKILGANINPATIEELNSYLLESVKSTNSTRIIASQNLHSIYIYHKDVKMRALHENAFKRVDGMPLIILGKLIGYPLNKEQRVTWVDYLDPFLKTITNNNLKLFYIGSKPDIAEKAINNFRKTYKGIQINYTNGYFNKEKNSNENLSIIQKIKNYQPDVLLVGMGMPIQEHWIYDNLNRLNVKVILTCGAAVEYSTGTVSTPPRWMGKAGLEWLFRLYENPKRFYKRYCIEPWFLLPLIFKDLFYAFKRNN
jgi:N-acetylglucosaminyldiphosphoundecaprenol N-acetyl-beta-D-mannosaminyltransferase